MCINFFNLGFYSNLTDRPTDWRINKASDGDMTTSFSTYPKTFRPDYSTNEAGYTAPQSRRGWAGAVVEKRLVFHKCLRRSDAARRRVVYPRLKTRSKTTSKIVLVKSDLTAEFLLLASKFPVQEFWSWKDLGASARGSKPGPHFHRDACCRRARRRRDQDRCSPTWECSSGRMTKPVLKFVVRFSMLKNLRIMSKLSDFTVHSILDQFWPQESKSAVKNGLRSIFR